MSFGNAFKNLRYPNIIRDYGTPQSTQSSAKKVEKKEQGEKQEQGKKKEQSKKDKYVRSPEENLQAAVDDITGGTPEVKDSGKMSATAEMGVGENVGGNVMVPSGNEDGEIIAPLADTKKDKTVGDYLAGQDPELTLQQAIDVVTYNPDEGIAWDKKISEALKNSPLAIDLNDPNNASIAAKMQEVSPNDMENAMAIIYDMDLEPEESVRIFNELLEVLI